MCAFNKAIFWAKIQTKIRIPLRDNISMSLEINEFMVVRMRKEVEVNRL